MNDWSAWLKEIIKLMKQIERETDKALRKAEDEGGTRLRSTLTISSAKRLPYTKTLWRLWDWDWDSAPTIGTTGFLLVIPLILAFFSVYPLWVIAFLPRTRANWPITATHLFFFFLINQRWRRNEGFLHSMQIWRMCIINSAILFFLFLIKKEIIFIFGIL